MKSCDLVVTSNTSLFPLMNSLVHNHSKRGDKIKSWKKYINILTGDRRKEEKGSERERQEELKAAGGGRFTSNHSKNYINVERSKRIN